jgi:geranylgeranyl diphosphate synthase type II
VPSDRARKMAAAARALTAGEVLDYMGTCRDLVLAELRSIVPSDRRHGRGLYDLMFEYPLREAKALRPALCIATCRALGGQLEGVLKSASVIELYHNAFLIHDDVEDGSELRRDLPTLHARHGVPIAVNVGDAMLALALEPLLGNMRDLGMGKALRILEAVSRMARETAEGQAMELSWIREGCFDLRDVDYLRMVHKKTSWYTFITPVVLGGMVAGSDARQLFELRRFATALGAAFQIQDDILNLTADPRRYGKEIEGDLWEGKHTLILMHAVRSATEAERGRAKTVLSKPRPAAARNDRVEQAMALLEELRRDGHLSDHVHARFEDVLGGGGETARYRTREDVDFLADLIRRSRSVDHARRVASRRARRAERSLQGIRSFMPDSEHARFLRGLTDFVLQRDH